MTHKNLKIINMLKIIRPYQWVKNILIFTPLLMSHNFDSDNLILSAKAFVIFSLMASSIYVINDIIDLKSDQNHPFKKYRPLAAKLITVNNCKILVLILLVLSAVLLLNVNKEFIIIIISYSANVSTSVSSYNYLVHSGKNHCPYDIGHKYFSSYFRWKQCY